MIKAISVLILAFFITKFLNIFFGEKNAATEAEKPEKTYIITAESGILGCLTKAKFQEAADDYTRQDFVAVKKLIAEEICFFFKKGEEVRAPGGTCSQADADNDLFPFSSERFKVVEPYLPCFAVR